MLLGFQNPFSASTSFQSPLSASTSVFQGLSAPPPAPAPAQPVRPIVQQGFPPQHHHGGGSSGGLYGHQENKVRAEGTGAHVRERPEMQLRARCGQAHWHEKSKAMRRAWLDRWEKDERFRQAIFQAQVGVLLYYWRGSSVAALLLYCWLMQ